MDCPPVRGDNPRALASGLSYVHVDINGIIGGSEEHNYFTSRGDMVTDMLFFPKA